MISREPTLERLAIAQAQLLEPYGLSESTLARALATIREHRVDDADLYFQGTRHEGWSLEEGIVKAGSFSISQGVGVRAVAGEKTAFAYSDDLSEAALLDAARTVRSIAAAGQQRRVRVGPKPRPARSRALYAAADPIATLDSAAKVALLERVERMARACDPRIVQVMASIAAEHDVVLIARADGTRAADVRPLVRVGVTVIAEQGGRREVGTSGGGGRFVAFASESTDLVAGDTNGVRDIFFYDMVSDQVRVVSQAPGGQLGDLASHKAVVSPDCHGMAISSEATNFIPGDGNGKRDIFWAEIVRPATFLASTLTAPPSAVPGETIKYKLHVVNSGDEAGAATVYVPIPAGATYVAGSVSLGGSYNAAQNRIEWSGSQDGGLSLTISYDVVIDPGLTAFTLVRSSGSVTSGSVTGNVSNTVAVNATNWTFLPVSAQSSVVYP